MQRHTPPERHIAATHTARAQQPDLNRSRPGEVGNRYIRIPKKKRAKLTALKDADGHGQRFGHCAGPIGHVLCGDEIFFF